MGRKKRTDGKSSSASAAAAQAGADERAAKHAPLQSGTVVESEGVDSPSFASIKIECDRAMNSLRIGNHTKALRLVKDLCLKHENSPHAALIHRFYGLVCTKVAAIIDDSNAKQRHLKNSIEAAKKAVSMSPNSIESAHFYANLLYDVANEGKEYEEVVQECEKALAIENPVDPGKESIYDSQPKLPTAELRIKHVKNELRNLIQKSNIASISNWMKHLGNGDEKFRLIPIRRVPEDPVDSSPVQARRPNEIQVATKTPEERRKEIEVRVAAARIIMQTSESAQTQNNGDKGTKNNGDKGTQNNGDKGLDPSAGLGQRGSDRRKNGNAKKNTSSTERRGWVKSYWNSMTMDMKKDLLRIRISDLKIHFGSLKDSLASEVLSEALLFSEVNKTWKFWTCCHCSEKFADPELHIHHVTREHLVDLSPKLQSVLPQKVDKEWAKMLLNCSWKPLDINAAAELLEKQSKPQEQGLELVTYQRNGVDESNDDDSNNEWDLSTSKKKLGDGHNGTTAESRIYEKISDIECIDFDGSGPNGGTKTCFLPDSWPISEDPERAKLLEKIRSAFQALIKSEYLASSHLSKVMHFAVEELWGVGSLLLNCNIDRTPLCICFLGSAELIKVLKFLQELSQSCGISRYSERINAIEDTNVVTKVADAMEKIVFSEDSLCLLFDEHFLSCKISPGRHYDAVTDDKIAAVSSNIPYDNGVLLDSDALLPWIFMGPSSGEQLECWSQLREEKARQGTEILRSMEKEFQDLQALCERKCEHLSYKEAVQAVEDLCLEEGKKREDATDLVCQSYDALLKKRREELMENLHDVANISNRIEVEAITNVLNDAESLNVSQLGYEGTYNGVTSHLSDLVSGEDDDWRVKDSCVEVAIQRQKEHNSVELGKIDARILRVAGGVRLLELKLEPISGNDYRRVLVPLVKSFLRAYLEDLAEKDATEKSDAAREAFLAELDRESKKSSGGGTDNPKHVTEKTKDKKKNKDYQKSKDSKVSSGNVLPIDHHDTSKDVSSQVANDGESQEDELVTAGSIDSLRQEECKLKIQLEAEEKRLQEALEHLRHLENEAKLKHLAEQFACLSHKEDQDTNEQQKSNEKVTDVLNLTDESLGVVESPKSTADVNADRTEIDDGAMPEDDTSLTDQSTGRQSRRQKGLTKSYEGKSQPVSSGREKKRVCAPISSDHLQEKVSSEMGDSGVLPDEVATGNVYGAGLQNEIGEYNCFLNVIIQSLWNLRCFRDEFLRSSLEHVHVGEPCVICALYDIFTAMSKASLEKQTELVSPTSLRVALSNLYPDSNFFQEGQMNDASEVLGVIFDCLHRSFTSGAPEMKPTDEHIGSYDCTNSACIVHSLFGMDVFQSMNCPNCQLGSRPLKYTTFFHNINAYALRTMKVMHRESSFDKLMYFVERSDPLPCDPDGGGCGKLNCIHHFLRTRPHVFTIVVGWKNTCESLDDIKETLAALSIEIDVSVTYHGIDREIKHRLVSVVCYCRQHYRCVAYSRDHEKWIVFDDQTVKEVGSSWDDVLTMCIKGHLQPQVLFFEVAN